MEKLNLAYTKPLVFIKIETTGQNPEIDKIIKLSMTKIELDGNTKTGTRIVNPEINISEEVAKRIGITNEQLKIKPTFKEVSDNINKFLEGCDFAGFNVAKNDLRFLSEEFNRVGIEFTLVNRNIVDISQIFNAMEPRDLSAAYKFYCNKQSEEKNNSQKTTEIYVEIINGMMNKYKDTNFIDKVGKNHKIESTVDFINENFNKNKKQLDIEGNIILNDVRRPIFSIGKYKGKIVADVLLKDKDYYDWLINTSKLPSDTKLIIKKILVNAEKAKLIAK